MKQPYHVAIVDDHSLLASSLEQLILSFGNYQVVHLSKHGVELQHNLQSHSILPDMVLLDINMPVMNGFETAYWLKQNHPAIPVLALSMKDDEDAIIQMLNNGCKGYLLKDTPPEKLRQAILEVQEYGYFHSDLVKNTLKNAGRDGTTNAIAKLKTNELKFIKLACTDMTYKQIAEVMHLSPKTIDGYRQEIFDKFEIKNRVGLVLFAIENNIVVL